jgi:hypothetical protein
MSLLRELKEGARDRPGTPAPVAHPPKHRQMRAKRNVGRWRLVPGTLTWI